MHDPEFGNNTVNTNIPYNEGFFLSSVKFRVVKVEYQVKTVEYRVEMVEYQV